MVSDPRYKAVKASRFALEIVKGALKAGKIVKVPSKVDGPEVLPVDLILLDGGDELATAKRVLTNEMN